MVEIDEDLAELRYYRLTLFVHHRKRRFFNFLPDSVCAYIGVDVDNVTMVACNIFVDD